MVIMITDDNYELFDYDQWKIINKLRLFYY